MEDIRRNNKMLIFKIPSHYYFKKGKVWFAAMFLSLAVFVGIFIYLKLYLGALVLGAMGVVIFSHSRIPPKKVSCAISKDGVKIGRRLHPYSSLKSFWIADVAPGPILYLEPSHRFRIIVSITLDNQPIEPIKRILKEHLPENKQREEEISDKLIRLFRF